MKAGLIASAYPRGVRAGERYALGSLVVERTGRDWDVMIATCFSPEDAADCAAAYNRRRARQIMSREQAAAIDARAKRRERR